MAAVAEAGGLARAGASGSENSLREGLEECFTINRLGISRR